MSEIIINYLIVTLFLLLFYILSSYEKSFSYRAKKGILVLAIISFSIFAGYRVIGTDINSYKQIFDEQPIIVLNFDFIQTMFEYYIEPGFVLIISYLKRYGLGFNVFLFLSAIIPLFVIYRVIFNHEKKHVFLTFLLFLLLYALRGPLDVIRQFFAAAIYLSALYSLSIKKEFRYFWKIIVSIFFHYSSILNFLIRPFLKIKWTIKKYATLFVSLFLLGFLFKNLILTITNNMDISNTDRILYKFQRYIDANYEVDSFLQGLFLYSTWYLPIFLNIILIVVAISYYKDICKSDFLKILLNSQILASLIFIFFWAMDSTILARRIEFTLSIGNFFILKEIIINLKGKNRLLFVFILMYLITFMIFQFLFLVQLRTSLF
ncbi:EpsG family protein [Bacillus sp. SD088]|uniref:EpsG family protein n=1 Tax=Bacillus sp. SD088 TaxID=2782012 RepID=UPI001A96BAE8|nr:EpsG family protein [Bacillus sp. SD088]MBO0991440.1 EpsG family protein [Bacillus sp. SD088]